MNARAASVWEHEGFEEYHVGSVAWRAGLIALICLLLIVLGIAGFIFPSVQPWLPYVLALITIALPVTSYFLSRTLTRSCATCGSTPMQLAWNLYQCPNCNGLFRDVKAALPRNGVLHLDEIVNTSDPTANALGLIIALGVRDAASELRVVGRRFGDDPNRPWNCICADWRMWLSLEVASHQIVPPPRQLGTGMFLILREIYRKASAGNTEGRACFRVEVEDCSVDAELVIEECEQAKVAKIVFDSKNPRQVWKEPRSYFENALTRVAGPDVFGTTPEETTWRRFPGFLPRWALIGISLIALVAGSVGVVAIIQSPLSSAGGLTLSFFVLALSAGLLQQRHNCSHCGAVLRQWPEATRLLWCPECRSIFDPSGQGLPMDGSTLRLTELARSGDPYVAKLVGLLDYALDCRQEKIEFSTEGRIVVVRLSKGGVQTRVSRTTSYDSRLCFELLAEISRRVREKSDDSAAVFQVIGRLYQATGTLSMEESDGERHATIELKYPEVSPD